MRVEPYAVDSYMHALKRGSRGLPIVGDEAYQWRNLRLLFYKNDHFVDENWERDTAELGMFGRPPEWPEQEPIVKILCYTLMPNHFHLLLKEIVEGGMSLFMKKIGDSMTGVFNEKYKSKGSIFQGSYKSKTVGEDTYLRYLAAYIMVKNVMELYPKGGLAGAVKNFEEAWEWALSYPFSSLGDYVGNRVVHPSPVIDKEILGELFATPREFKAHAKEVILAGKWLEEKKVSRFAALALE